MGSVSKSNDRFKQIIFPVAALNQNPFHTISSQLYIVHPKTTPLNTKSESSKSLCSGGGQQNSPTKSKKSKSITDFLLLPYLRGGMKFFRRNSSKNNKEDEENKKKTGKNKNNNNSNNVANKCDENKKRDQENKNLSKHERQKLKDDEKRKEILEKKSTIGLRKCDCKQQIRSESFYDIFLATSVKNSQAYKDLLQARSLREPKEVVMCYLADEEIDKASAGKYFNANPHKRPIKVTEGNGGPLTLININSHKQFSVLKAADHLIRQDNVNRK